VITRRRATATSTWTRSADLDDAHAIILNAKTQRPGVCNAAETLLVHADVAERFLPGALGALHDAGVELRGDDRVRAAAGGVPVVEVTEEDYADEFLALVLAVRVVDSAEEAIEHVNTFGLRPFGGDRDRVGRAARAFQLGVDAACVYVTRRRGSPTAGSSGWAPRSATRRRSCTRAGRSACASCATFKYLVEGSARSGPRSACARRATRGTFNPPHIAHLVCAQEALVQLGLDRVLLVPAAVPPHKASRPTRAVAHRVAMCEAAVAGDERLGVSRADADRAEPAYTVELLRTLRAAAPEDELSFIVAATWRTRCRPGASPRRCSRSPGSRWPSVRASGGPTSPSACRTGRRARSGSTSSTCRGWTSPARCCAARAAAGGPLRYLVPRRGGGLHHARAPVHHAATGAVGRPPILGGQRMTEPTGSPTKTDTSDPAGLARPDRGVRGDKKAIDVAELDLRGVLGYTDFFVVCSGNTDRQTKAIHDGIHQGLKNEYGLLPAPGRGTGRGALDPDGLPGTSIVHVFTPEAREFYRLEQLWGEAPRRAMASRTTKAALTAALREWS